MGLLFGQCIGVLIDSVKNRNAKPEPQCPYPNALEKISSGPFFSRDPITSLFDGSQLIMKGS